MQEDETATISEKNPRQPRRPFSLTEHALVRYIERASRIPLDMLWLSLHRQRFAVGIFEDPTDGELLDHIEKGTSLERLRRKFFIGLRRSRLLHQKTKADFLAIGGRLVALVDPANDKVMTVITAEMAKNNMPISALKKSGILTEKPARTLTDDELLANTGFRYAIGRTDCDPAKITSWLSENAPEILVVALKPPEEVIAVIRMRVSLEKARSGGCTAVPYIASYEEFLSLEPGPDAVAAWSRTQRATLA
jgi:hypothetical protein